MQRVYLSTSQIFERFEDRHKSFIGYIWSLLAACCATISAFYVKLVPKEIPSSEIMFYRSIMLSAFTYAFMNIQKSEFHFANTSINRLLLIRGAFGVTATACSFYGLRFLSLSDSMVLSQISPVATGLFAWLILGEKYEIIQFWTASACILGVVFIAQPEFLFSQSVDETAEFSSRTIGVIALLLSSVFNGLAFVFVRKAGSKTNVGITSLYFSHGSGILAAILCIFQGVRSFGFHTFIQITLTAIPGFFGQLLRNRAFILVKAGRVSIMTYFSILLAYVLDVFVLDTEINAYSLLGALCISSCIFFYMYEMYQREKDQ